VSSTEGPAEGIKLAQTSESLGANVYAQFGIE